MSHPVHDLDDLIHQRIRLGVMALLSRVEAAEFMRIKAELHLTAGNLSRHLQALSDANLITISKDGSGYHRASEPTWVSLTPQGHKALQKEVTALRSLLDHLPPDPDQ